MFSRLDRAQMVSFVDILCGKVRTVAGNRDSSSRIVIFSRSDARRIHIRCANHMCIMRYPEAEAKAVALHVVINGRPRRPLRAHRCAQTVATHEI